MRRAPLFYTILGLCLFHVPMPSGADEEGQAPSEPSLEQLALALLCEAFLNHDNILVFAKQEIDPNYSAYQEPDRLAELNLRRMNQVGSSLRGETPFFFYVNGLQKWRYMSVIFNRPISSAQLPPKYRPRMGGEDPRVWLLALEKTETVPVIYTQRTPVGRAGMVEDIRYDDAVDTPIRQVLRFAGFDRRFWQDRVRTKLACYRFTPWNAAFPIATGDRTIDRRYSEMFMMPTGVEKGLRTIFGALHDPLFQDDPARLAGRVRGVASLLREPFLKRFCRELGDAVEKEGWQVRVSSKP